MQGKICKAKKTKHKEVSGEVGVMPILKWSTFIVDRFKGKIKKTFKAEVLKSPY
jgi:hypothetical protein